MITRGIRGAITVDENTPESIGSAVIKLLQEIVKRNNIDLELISHVIFSATSDLYADNPAKYARINLKWKDVPMMCFNEMEVPGSLHKCIRVLVVVNCSESFEPEFVYLDGAKDLRK